MPASLELRGVAKSFDGQPLLRRISFRIGRAETVCLLGPSGSGKSTLLRMIAGLDFPDEGRILFDGQDLTAQPPHTRDFGLVFQDYALFPHLDVFDNIAFGLRMHRISNVALEERVATLLSQVDLRGYEHRRVNELSGGEQQRVALARALAPNPRLLMFDEPLGALDRELKEDLLNELRRILKESKIPALYVTHDQEEAFAIGHRILLLHDGRIVRAGAPAAVWSEPASPWAARFLGQRNIVDGEVLAAKKVRTDYGVFDLTCKHRHRIERHVSLRLTQVADENVRGKGFAEITLRVRDVLFARGLYQVRASSGLFIQLKTKPRLGERLRVRVKVECLDENPKEKSRRPGRV